MATFWSTMWSKLIGGTTTERNRGIQYAQPAYAEPAAVSVTEDTAMQVSAVWACVRLLSETVASLPLDVYRKRPEGRILAPDFYFAQLMSRKPNRYQTRQEFMETMMLNLTLHGNAYALIERVGGRIRSIMPLMSAQVEVKLMDDGSITYQYTRDNNVAFYSESSIWHVKLYGNGIIGKSPLAFGRNMVGIAQAAEQTTTKVYKNGGKRSGVLTLDKLLTPSQREQVRENFSSLTTSTDDRLLVLEMGMQFEPISMSPQDIELLASRRFQLEEICRWFGVPSVMVNDTSGSTTWGSGIEQIVSGFYKLNLRPYLERFEASIQANLFTEAESQEYEVEFDFEGLLRSDLKSRLEGYRTAVAGSILTPNEVRRIEGWASMEGGDDLLSQVNMATLQSISVSAEAAAVDGEPTEASAQIQQASLNGAQVTSLLEVINAISTGQLPIETGRAIINSSFPVISATQLQQIIGPLENFEPTNGGANETQVTQP
jgi:HK97 family phage portal protein